MSIFGRILSKIFPGNHPAVQAGANGAPAASPGAAAAKPATPAATGAAAPASMASTTAAAAPSAASGTATAAAAPAVDVEAVMKDLAAKNPGPANWRTSIVDR
jgi:hypothetical protein